MNESTPEAYEKLLRGLADHLGLDGDLLARTQELVIDDLSVGLAYEGLEGFGDVLYFVNLGATQPGCSPEVYRTLLQANNMWAGTGGATLGLQSDTGNVILAGRVDLSTITPEGLAAMLDGFSDTGQFWKLFVAGTVDPGQSTSIPFGMRL